MEAQEEVTHIVKGKRTKRQRPQSPIPFSMNIASDSPSGDGDGYGDGGFIDVIDNNTNLSPTSTVQSTEEEEDMANCLILLAQGQSRDSPKQAEEEDHGGVYKINSRRFLETAAAATGTGKAGYCVYECKTCSRTFPSFQALGGHRASHKKPKAMAAEEKTKQFLLSSDDEEAQFIKKNHEISSLSLQLSSTRGLCGNSRSKVHECSVCGAEFTSGQALGGHMRRHRAPLATNTALSLIPPMALEPDQEPKKPRHVLSLDLDLNLPAPEDDHREPKFPFATKQQQQQQQQPKQQQQQQQQQQSPLVFSAPTLVDCHY